MIALLLVLSVFFHTTTQLDDWFNDWGTNDYLSNQQLAEFRDLLDRHPQLGHDYVKPQVRTTPITARGMGNDVEQWVPLILVYFPAAELDLVLCVMTAESGGNPNAYNPSSGASGLFQHIPKYWADRSTAAGWAGASIWDPVANTAVAAWLSARDGWGHWNPYIDGRCND